MVQRLLEALDKTAMLFSKGPFYPKFPYASDNKGFAALQIPGINFLKRSRLKALCDQLDLYTFSLLLKCGFIGHKVFYKNRHGLPIGLWSNSHTLSAIANQT